MPDEYEGTKVDRWRQWAHEKRNPLIAVGLAAVMVLIDAVLRSVGS